MYWTDEGYLLSKNNFDENSLIIEAFTLEHGKYSGIVYGGSSRKHKRNFQVGNKILINWRSKGQNRKGYFNVELIKPIAPVFFDNKKKIASIVSASSILKILLPEGQSNKNIYSSYEKLLNNLNSENWISCYILWEISLIKDLGYEISAYKDKNIIQVNGKSLQVPDIILNNEIKPISDKDIKNALIFNKNLFMENFIIPNKLNFPLFRNILERYYN